MHCPGWVGSTALGTPELHARGAGPGNQPSAKPGIATARSRHPAASSCGWPPYVRAYVRARGCQARLLWDPPHHLAAAAPSGIRNAPHRNWAMLGKAAPAGGCYRVKHPTTPDVPHMIFCHCHMHTVTDDTAVLQVCLSRDRVQKGKPCWVLNSLKHASPGKKWATTATCTHEVFRTGWPSQNPRPSTFTGPQV